MVCVSLSSLVEDNVGVEASTMVGSVGSKVQLKSGTARLLTESDGS